MKKGSEYIISNFILIFFLIITSCKNSKSPDVQSVIDKVLKGREFPLSESKCPFDIQIADSLIIIIDACDSYIYHVYNSNSLKFLGKFAKGGRGPFEYQYAAMMKQVVRKRDSSYIYLYDRNGIRIDGVNILEAINKAKNNVNYYPQKLNIRLSDLQRFFAVNSIVFTADSFIVGSGQNNNIEGRFFCFEIATRKISWEPFYPEFKKTPHKDMRDELYISLLALRPDGEQIAVASRFFKSIDILDKKGRLLRSVVLDTQNKEPDFSSNQSIPPKGSYLNFVSITVNQKFIYALDVDMKSDVFPFMVSNRIRDTISLYMADWEGNLIRRYKLTPRVLRVTVDEENHKIYGVNEANESGSVFVYDLN